MKVNVSLAVVLSVAIGGVSILAVIISMAWITVSGRDIPSGLLALYGGVVTGFLASLAAVISHTIAFNNGTVNGEAQAQAQALRLTMGTEQDHKEHSP